MFYHNEHLSVGFILLVVGQLKAFENSSEFESVPRTLKIDVREKLWNVYLYHKR